MKICRVATIPFVFTYHLRSQIAATVQEGHEVYLVSSPSKELETVARETGTCSYPITIHRNISLWRDLKSLFQLYLYFRKMNFGIVHSMTQKAGLLTALAGFLTRVPIRLHTFTGQPWMHQKGIARSVAKICDWLIIKLNTRCYTDSESQRNYLVQEGVSHKKGLKILGPGSLAGIDLQRFRLEKWQASRDQIRRELNIPETAKIINFTGRINLEKGIQELIDAFENLSIKQLDIFLLLVGPFEVNRDPVPPELMQRIKKNPHIRTLGDSPQPEKFFAVSDLLCLPSYREGFGIVVLEAAAMGIPTIGTRVVGLVDSVIDGQTGILVSPRDSQALQQALEKILNDYELQKKMGQNAMEHVQSFDSRHINALVLKEYSDLLELC